jgi:hypothetical protein
MAANKGGDSKQGLIIALVICVLLIIILGVVSYYGYAEQANLQADAKKARDEKAAMEKNRDWYKFQALLMRTYAGYPAKAKEDAEAFPVPLRDQFESKSLSGDKEVETLVETLDKTLGWDKNQKKPLATYVQRVSMLENDLRNTILLLEKEKAALAKTREDYDRFQTTKDEEVKDWKTKFEQAQKDNVATQQNLAKEYQAKIDELGDLSQQIQAVTKKYEKEAFDRGKENTQLKNTIKDLQDIRVKLVQKITPPDLLRFSTPKGRIVRLEPRGEMAWINLGSADNIRSQQRLTFSIFGSGSDGRSTNDVRKGSLEVVSVLEPHFSTAKITEIVDPARNPIMTGDLLINPAWSPTQREHVALAGLIDLTGDGNDYSEEFMRNLRQQGVVIDAYLDLKDLTLKGDGITLKTDYLIVGEQPEIDPTKTSGRKIERDKEIYDKIAALTNDANRLGVSVVPFRRFVQLTGYRLPRGASVQQRYNFESVRTPAPTPAPADRKEPAKKDDKPAAKEEKKDDGK